MWLHRPARPPGRDAPGHRHRPARAGPRRIRAQVAPEPGRRLTWRALSDRASMRPAKRDAYHPPDAAALTIRRLARSARFTEKHLCRCTPASKPCVVASCRRKRGARAHALKSVDLGEFTLGRKLPDYRGGDRAIERNELLAG